jgi:large subunit ribosomal protein L32
MAVPKKRTGHSAQGKRRANWKAEKPALSKCSNCGATVLAHTVCSECGFYKGKPASLKAVAEPKKAEKSAKEVEVKEEKPTKKTTAKKAEATEKKPAKKTSTKKAVKTEEKASEKEDK